MPVVVRYTVTDRHGAVMFLRGLRERLVGDMTPLTSNVSDDLSAEAKANIEESRTPGGKTYPDLKRVKQGKSPRPKGHGQDPRPLIDSGKLLGSIAPLPAPRRAAAVYGMPYGVFHDSRRPRKKIPYRGFMGFRPGTRGRIRSRVREYIVEAVAMLRVGVL